MLKCLTDDDIDALLTKKTISERDFQSIVYKAIFEVMEHRKELERLHSIIDKP